jgi:hypothetical protein
LIFKVHKLAQSERNSTLIGNSSLCTHVPNIKSIFQIIVKKKWRSNRSSFIGIGLVFLMQVL